MPDEEVVEYINSNIKKGYSHDEIKEVMIETGYSGEEVDSLFENLKEPIPITKPENKFSLKIFIILIFALGAVLTILTIPIIFYSGFGKGGYVGHYLLILFMALIGGYIIKKSIEIFTAKSKYEILAGTLSSFISLTLIFVVFLTKSKIYKYLKLNNPRGALDFLQTVGVPHNPIISSLLFFVVLNVFIIKDIKERKELIWYVTALPIYIISWVIATIFAGSYIATASTPLMLL